MVVGTQTDCLEKKQPLLYRNFSKLTNYNGVMGQNVEF